MPIHLRQVCLVAHELKSSTQEIEEVLGLPVCHRDPGVATFGLENALFALGSQFLEVVAPVRSGTAAGRFLERKGGPGGYMVIGQVATRAEQADIRSRAQDNHVRVAYESERDSWNIMQLHPRDMGAAFLEVDWDEQSDMLGNWQPAGGLAWARYARPDQVSAITALELSDPDPDRLAAHWSQVIGQPVIDRNDSLCIRLANAVLRFVPESRKGGRGLTAMDVTVNEPETLLSRANQLGIALPEGSATFCGVRINFIGPLS